MSYIDECKNQDVWVLNFSTKKQNDLRLKIQIEKTNYYDHVMEFVDETTTPRGVDSRVFVEEEELTIDVDDLDEDGSYQGLEHIPACLQDDFGNPILSRFQKDNNGDYYTSYWVISSWGVGGNNYSNGKYHWNNVFVEEEKAVEELFKRVEKYDFAESNHDTTYYDSEEEAEEEKIRLYSEWWGVSEATVKSILHKRAIIDQRKYELSVIQQQKQREIEAQEDKLAEKYALLIEPMDESFKESMSRLGKALPEKLNKRLFIKSVKALRRRS